MNLPQTLSVRIRNAIFEPVAPYREIPPPSFSFTLPSLMYHEPGNLVSPNDFFRFQHETSSVIDRIKDEAISQYHDFFAASFPSLNRSLFHLHEKRRNTVRHRGVFSRVCALALQSREHSFLPRLGASVEFLLEYMYYVNQVLDSKSHPNYAINAAAASASVTLGEALITSFENEAESSQDLSALLQTYASAKQGFDYGEFHDCTYNIWQNLQKSSLEQRLASCNHRTYYINALFYQLIAELVEKTLSLRQHSPDASYREALSAYAHSLGMGLQIVNDVADFVPSRLQRGTSEKTPDDAYSDIKHGMMTYPVLAMLELASSSERPTVISALEQGVHTLPQTLEEITCIFLRSGAYHECRALARKYKQMASDCANNFYGDARFLLSHTSVFLDSNRYYHALSSFYEQMKGGEYHENT